MKTQFAIYVSLFAFTGPFATQSLQAQVDLSCPSASALHTDSKPPEAISGLANVPWVAATPRRGASRRLWVVGYLFYVPRDTQQRSAYIYVHGTTPSSGATKILWQVSGVTTESQLTALGRRIDGPGTFKQRFPQSGSGRFPSILRIPYVGCWRIELAAGQSVSASVTINALP